MWSTANRLFWTVIYILSSKTVGRVKSKYVHLKIVASCHELSVKWGQILIIRLHVNIHWRTRITTKHQYLKILIFCYSTSYNRSFRTKKKYKQNISTSFWYATKIVPKSRTFWPPEWLIFFCDQNEVHYLVLGHL